MQDNYIRMDLALIENRKGTLVLDNNGLSYTSKKGLNFSIPVTDIRKFIPMLLKAVFLYILP